MIDKTVLQHISFNVTLAICLIAYLHSKDEVLGSVILFLLGHLSGPGQDRQPNER